MAGAKGLEPSAFCVTGRRYNQLNYAPIPFRQWQIIEIARGVGQDKTEYNHCVN